MPNLNMGRFIGTAVQSVLDQSFEDFELIVVDSGSSDESVSEVERLSKGDDRVKLLVDTSKKGVSYARNKAMRLASGRYYSFVDSDDVIRPQRLALMVEALERLPQHIAFSDIFRIDENGRVIRSSLLGRLPDEGNAYASILTRQIQGQHTMMVPASAVEKVGGFNESISWGEDFDFLLRLTEIYRVAIVKEPLYGYRTHEASASACTPIRSKGTAYINIIESSLQKNWGLLDNETRLKAISRIQGIAKESHLMAKNVRWKIDPRFVRLVSLRLAEKVLHRTHD
jgi:glycosyltransferase involved in cell wall biosynthesis